MSIFKISYLNFCFLCGHDSFICFPALHHKPTPVSHLNCECIPPVICFNIRNIHFITVTDYIEKQIFKIVQFHHFLSCPVYPVLISYASKLEIGFFLFVFPQAGHTHSLLNAPPISNLIFPQYLHFSAVKTGGIISSQLLFYLSIPFWKVTRVSTF